ncbi:MAG: ERCC4 domain-containing protein [Pseudodesulfovibrio sp.]|uniref:ERCC4 domain-containing protein n=1 Tax=Pseudodesulfovibrio sp. TaxID=2035812 RepID=UPI003D0EF0D0
MVVVIDSREQLSLDFSRWGDVSTETGMLTAGDYSLRGLEDKFALERKSIPDLVASITTGRERLIRELERLRGYEVKAIIVEGTLEQVARHEYRSRTSPESVLQTLAAWQIKYDCSTLWCGSSAGCAYMVRALGRHYLRDAQLRLKAVIKAHGEVVAA